MSYVYLIRHATEPRFKIGKSNEPIGRSKSFGDDLDLENSLQIHLGHRAYGIEKGLHAILDAYRLPPVSTNDGATEWFRLECWNRCLAFFEQHNDLISELPTCIQPPPATILTAAEKANRRQQRIDAERKQQREIDAKEIESWEQFLHWLDSREVVEERIDQFGRLSIVLLGIAKEDAQAFVTAGFDKQRCFSTHTFNCCCGIETTEWCEDGGQLTLNFRRLDLGHFEDVRANMHHDLRARFEAMDFWIAARIDRTRSTME